MNPKTRVTLFMKHGLRPLVNRAAVDFLATIGALFVSAIILVQVHQSGGLAEMIARLFASACVTNQSCDLNGLMLGLELSLILVVYVVLLMVRILKASADQIDKTDERMEDAEFVEEIRLASSGTATNAPKQAPQAR